MLFNKNKNVELTEAPLGYWEEYSYMVIIPQNNKNPLIGLPDRVADIKGVKILEHQELTDKEPGLIKVLYKDIAYELYYYPSTFELHECFLTNTYYFSQDTIEKLRESSKSLTIYMKFSENIKDSYHLQLKLADAIVPEMLALLDESAERLLPAKWVTMSAESKITPGPTDLYIVQAVTEKNEIWLHTHGLCRCGLTELEILQSDKDNYHKHYNLLSSLANYLIDKGPSFDIRATSAYIGILENRQPIVATALSWTKSLPYFKKLRLGGLADRQDGHNTKSSVIFLYESEQNEEQNILSLVSVYNDLLGENPIYFISNEETQRMKELAIEKFDYVKEIFKPEENQVLIKIGLLTDDHDPTNLEHIWFELLELKDDKFKAKLTQEPYNVSNIKVGDTKWFTPQDITDWIIYTKEQTINPNNVYLLK